MIYGKLLLTERIVKPCCIGAREEPKTHGGLNPSGIVPKGPEVDWAIGG